MCGFLLKNHNPRIFKRKNEQPKEAIHTKMKNRLSKQIQKFINQNYMISILFVLLLLFVSLTGPGLLFDIQDHLQVRKTWQGLGNSLDIELLNASYGDKKERFAKFAQGLSEGKKYYASGMDVSLTKEEQISIMEQAIPSYYYSGEYKVIDWKKYIIFDRALADNNASVAFMTWYIELLGEDENSIKILVDTEDLTVYYIKVNVSAIGDIISSELYVNNNFLFEYFEPDSIEHEAPEYKGKKYNLPANYYINMYFGNYPLLWELISDPHLQAGFSDMRVLILELEE